MNKKGFIKNPFSKNRGDSIKASVLVKKVSDNASKGCGLYYEIYEYRALSQLLQILEKLNTEDKLTFESESKKQGFNLDNKSISSSYISYRETMDEVYKNQF